MGASWNEYTTDELLPKSKLEHHHADVCEDDAYESGNSYSGGFNMCGDYGLTFVPKDFDNDEQAREHAQEHHPKWQRALACRVMDGKPHWFVGAWCAS